MSTSTYGVWDQPPSHHGQLERQARWVSYFPCSQGERIAFLVNNGSRFVFFGFKCQTLQARRRFDPSTPYPTRRTVFFSSLLPGPQKSPNKHYRIPGTPEYHSGPGILLTEINNPISSSAMVFSVTAAERSPSWSSSCLDHFPS